MLRRITPRISIAQQKALLLSGMRYQSNFGSKADEKQREEQAREELTKKGYWNPWQTGPVRSQASSVNNQETSSSSSSNTSSSSSGGGNNKGWSWGSPPPPPNMDGANFKRVHPMRSFAMAVVTYTFLVMTYRSGITGDYSYIMLPSWIQSPEERAKWAMFVFSIDRDRRRSLQHEYTAMRRTNPLLSLWDYVDQAEPYWRWSSQYSKEQVTATVAHLMRTQPVSSALGAVRGAYRRANAGGSWFSFTLSAPTFGAEERSNRVNDVMRTLTTSYPELLTVTSTPGTSSLGMYGSYPSQPPQQWQPQQQQFQMQQMPSPMQWHNEAMKKEAEEMKQHPNTHASPPQFYDAQQIQTSKTPQAGHDPLASK